MNHGWKGKTFFLLVLMSMLIVVSACSGAGKKNQVLPELEEDEKATIKVTYWNEESFFREFGNLFLMQYPNIDIEVVSTNNIYGPDKDPVEAMKQFFETEQPDVLMLSSYDIEQYIKEGMLYELDPVIAQDEFDIENMLPSAVEALRNMGEGKLYGLAPTFSSSALFYNKTLFNENGIPLPTDGMTWDEVLQLAERFPTDGDEETRIYGLDINRFPGSDSWRLTQLGSEQGLTFIDTVSKRITMNTDSWKKTAELALRLATSKAIYSQDPNNSVQSQSYEEYLLSDPFIGGKTAMKIQDSYLLGNLKEAKTQLKEKFSLEWDVVSVPEHADQTSPAGSFSFNQIFAINAKSPNQRAAWEFVKFINSDTVARVTSRAPSLGGIPVRTQYIRNDDGIHMEAFYNQGPRPSNMYASYRELPQNFFMQFDGIIAKHWDAVMKETITIEEMLALIETEAQAALDKAIEEQAANPGNANSEGEPEGAEVTTEVVTEQSVEVVQE